MANWIATILRTHYEQDGKIVDSLDSIDYRKITPVTTIQDSKLFLSKSTMKHWLKQNNYSFVKTNKYYRKSFFGEYNAVLAKV